MEPLSQSLGGRLSRLFDGGFFRPLGRPSAAVYVDCADRLVEAADDGGQVLYPEARILIREVLARHPDVQLDEDEGGAFRDLNQRAGQFFNKLLEAHWLEPRRVSLDEHFVLITPALRRLNRMLRELAEDRPAELKDFAVTLRSLCADLLREDVLNPAKLGPEEMRQTVKDMLDRAGRAEEQMHMVETLILRQEEAQRESASAQETLQRFLVEFHSGEHMVCYDAMQEAGLLPKLSQARSVVQEAAYDPFTKQRLAEGLAKHLGLETTAAYTEAERWLLKLERRLAAIPVKQRLIDGRMADFARLSDARHRYQTEMRGRRPEQVKTFLDEASRIHAGKSFASLAAENGMPLLSPVVAIWFGTDSLSPGRKQRAAVNLDLGASPADVDAESAKDEIRRRNLNILTPQRAVRFVESHLSEKGQRVSTETLRIKASDDLLEMLDLLAVLAFDRGISPSTKRNVRWRVHLSRAECCTEPGEIPRDREGKHVVERFEIERIA